MLRTERIRLFCYSGHSLGHSFFATLYYQIGFGPAESLVEEKKMRLATLVAALAAVADVATAIQTASQTALPTRRPEDMDVNVTLPHVPSSKSAEIWDDFKHEATCKGCQVKHPSSLVLLVSLDLQRDRACWRC